MLTRHGGPAMQGERYVIEYNGERSEFENFNTFSVPRCITLGGGHTSVSAPGTDNTFAVYYPAHVTQRVCDMGL